MLVRTERYTLSKLINVMKLKNRNGQPKWTENRNGLKCYKNQWNLHVQGLATWSEANNRNGASLAKLITVMGQVRAKLITVMAKLITVMAKLITVMIQLGELTGHRGRQWPEMAGGWDQDGSRARLLGTSKTHFPVPFASVLWSKASLRSVIDMCLGIHTRSEAKLCLQAASGVGSCLES